MNQLTHKKLIARKKTILYQILLDSDNDISSCDEALNILVELFGDADLTLIKHTSMSVQAIATTLNNQDNIHALIGMVQYYLLSEKNSLSNNLKVKARPDVLTTKPIKLVTDKEYSVYLLIDYYEKEYLDIEADEYEEILKLLSLIVRLNIVEEERKMLYKIDGLTRLLSRDSLIKDIKKLSESGEEYHLSTLYLSNGATLNQERGYQYTDDLLMNISKVLQKMANNEHVYRIGGMKFAVLIKNSLQESVFLMQSILDKISDLDIKINCSVMVIPLLDDPYKTVYTSEKYLKELDTNTVTVFREQLQDDMDDDFMRFTELVIPKENEITYVDESTIHAHQTTAFTVEDVIVEDTKQSAYEEEEDYEEEEIVLEFDE